MAEFEPNYLRKTYRVTLPAKVEIEGKEFKTTDWSFEGFGIEKEQQDRFHRDKEYVVTFIVPFAGFSISFKAKAKLAWQSENRAGFEFLQLPEEAKLVLREYIEAYVEGRLKDVESIISAADIQTVPPYLDKPLTEEEKKALDRKFKVRLLIYSLLFFLLLALFYLVVIYSPVVYSVEAFFSGRMINVVSPVKAVISEVKVKESQEVMRRQPLVVLERIDLSAKENPIVSVVKVNRELAGLEAQREKLKGEIEKNIVRIKSIKEELNQIEHMLRNYREAYSKGYISKKVVDDMQREVKKLRSELEILQRDILQKERMLSSLNKKIASLRISSSLPPELKKKLYDTMEVSPDGLTITLLAPSRGTVLSIYKKPGEIVRSGEPLLALEGKGKNGYVIGRFKKKDAMFINVGNRAVVYFPSLGVSVKGRVSAVGKFGLYGESIVSESEEYALEDVPVKVILEEVPQGVHQGLKAEISIKTENYKPYILQLIERWLNES